MIKALLLSVSLGTMAIKALAFTQPTPIQDIKSSKLAFLEFRAFSGEPDAMHIYGLARLIGHEIEADTELAIKMLEGASKRGHLKATRTLADIYYDGEFVQQNLVKAHFWYSKIENPDEWVRFRLGFILAYGAEGMKPDCGQAIKYFDNIDDVVARGNLVWLLATCPNDAHRDGKRAIRLGLINLAYNRNDPVHLDNLAAAYAEAGMFEQATTLQERAVMGAASRGEQQKTEDFKRRLDHYKTGKPYRDPLLF